MNYSKLGELLHMTRSGARFLVLRNEKELKPYLIIKNKKIVGVSEDAVEIIRDMKMRESKIDSKKSFEIDKLKLVIENLENEKRYLQMILTDKEKQCESLKIENEKLLAILSQYENLNFFQRLLGYRKSK